MIANGAIQGATREHRGVMEAKIPNSSKIVIGNLLIYTKSIGRARIVADQAKTEVEATPGLKEGYVFVDGEKIRWVLAV